MHGAHHLQPAWPTECVACRPPVACPPAGDRPHCSRPAAAGPSSRAYAGRLPAVWGRPLRHQQRGECGKIPGLNVQAAIMAAAGGGGHAAHFFSSSRVNGEANVGWVSPRRAERGRRRAAGRRAGGGLGASLLYGNGVQPFSPMVFHSESTKAADWGERMVCRGKMAHSMCAADFSHNPENAF